MSILLSALTFIFLLYVYKNVKYVHCLRASPVPEGFWVIKNGHFPTTWRKEEKASVMNYTDVGKAGLG